MSDTEEGELVGEPNHDWAASYDDAQNQHPAVAGNNLIKHSQASDSQAWAGWDHEAGVQMQQGKAKKKKKKVKVKGHHGAAQAQTPPGAGSALGYYDVYGGTTARASVEIKAIAPIQLRDVQALVLWVLGESICPRWLFVKNKPLIDRVVLVMAHGLTEHLFNEHKEHLTNLAALGRPAVTIALNSTAKPSQSVSTLLHVPMDKKRKREVHEEERAAKQARGGGPPFPPSHYTMSLKDMVACEFPVPELGPDGQLRAPDGYVATRPPPARPQHEAPPDPFKARMVALDCEMCTTAQGLELTRATLVSSAGEVLMDELVVPHNPITDYNTRYSGITPDMLQNVTTRLEDVQRRMLELVDADTILCGHALDNDLRALRLVHTRVVDSSALYPHARGPPYRCALKALAQRFLQRSIQHGPHDSAEDARAAMDLVLLKIKHGPSYGTQEHQFLDKLADVLASSSERPVGVTFVDRPAMLARNATGRAAAIPAASDAQCAELTAKQVARQLRWGAAAAASQSSACASSSNGVAGMAREDNGGGGGGSQSFVWAQLHELAEFYLGRSQLERKRQRAAASASKAAREAPPPADGTVQNGHAQRNGDADAAAAGGPSGAKQQQVANREQEVRVGAKRKAACLEAEPAQQQDQQQEQQQQQQQQQKVVKETPLQRQKRQLLELAEYQLGEAGHSAASKAGKCKAAKTEAAGPQPPLKETPLQRQQRQLKEYMIQEDLAQQLVRMEQREQRQQEQEERQREDGALPDEDLDHLASKYSDQQLLATLKSLDRHVGVIHAALPVNALLIVASGQGDTARTTRLQESKLRRQAGLEQPAWSVAEEEAYAALVDREMRALCFAVVKQ